MSDFEAFTTRTSEQRSDEMRARRQRTRRSLVAALARLTALATVFLASASAQGSETFSREIYQLTMESAQDVSATPVTVYVALASGERRQESGDRMYVSAGGVYAVLDRASDRTYRRIGSRSFLGYLDDFPDSALAVRQYVHGDATLANRGVDVRAVTRSDGKVHLRALREGQEVFRVTIERQISDQEAEAAGLFSTDTPTTTGITLDRELPVGQRPTLPIEAYWFGPQFERARLGSARAVTALEHQRRRSAIEAAAEVVGGDRADVSIHVTFYELPGVVRSSAEPGEPTPSGEVQVVSQPVATPHAEAVIAAMNGRNGDITYPAWPRSEITLADGTKAVVVPAMFEGAGPARPGFSVITDSTLVNVTGEFAVEEIPTIAASLRPLR